MSPLYLVKLKYRKNGLLLSAVRSVEPIVPNFVSFPVLIENSFSSFLTESILRSHGFYQKFILKLNMVDFSM